MSIGSSCSEPTHSDMARGWSERVQLMFQKEWFGVAAPF